MRSNNLIIPALLFILADSVGCKEEPPVNSPGEFGEPCDVGALADTPDGCLEGLYCYEGYCEEMCADDMDCQPVEGWAHDCVAGICQIFCDDNDSCPQDLGTELTCKPIGSARLCEAREDAS